MLKLMSLKRRLMKIKILLYTLIAILCFSPSILAEDIRKTFAYKLAVLHIQELDPNSYAAEPDRAMVGEFYVIMETLKKRCINSESDMADTIVTTSKFVKKSGYSMPLLTVAKELTKTAQNKMMFGDQKVDFRTTSSFWIQQFQEEIKKRK